MQPSSQNCAPLWRSYHSARTSCIIQFAGRLTFRIAGGPMNHRMFLFNTGIVGAGWLGAGNAAPGFLRAGTAIKSDLNLKLEEKPVAFTVPPLPYAFYALEPSIATTTMALHHANHQ